MILLIILFLPLVTGLILRVFRNDTHVKILALASTIITLILTLSLWNNQTEHVSINWLPFLGSSFSLGYDGLSYIMLLLTNLIYPFIVLTGFKSEQKRTPVLYELILFTQSALSGVFLAQNAFLFYVFWELALIPVYFILLIWGGRGRRSITLKFFIYTLAGSLFLLFGIIFLYQLTPGDHTTDFAAFALLNIPAHTQVWLFWILFVAFAIKMPMFPFHSWQPSTYTMAPAQGVMILAGVMTKMGIYGALRFIFPIVPAGALYWQDTIIVLSLIGMVYASVIAFRQTNLKRLIAFSSMAHISLMTAAMFVLNYYALQGLLFQVLSHGVTIVALFYIVSVIEKQTGTLDLAMMGGFRQKVPNMAILLLIVTLGSIALPLTSGFVGEFLMITGLFNQSGWFAVFGGLTMILGAIYMLYAYQRVMLGELKPSGSGITDLTTTDYIILFPLTALILLLGVFPQPILMLVDQSVTGMQNLLMPLADAVSQTLL